jgi:subtilase family serine protease
MQTALAFACALYFSLIAAAQTANIPARVTQPVDVEKLVTLRGNTHPLARPEYDQGAAPDSLPMERMLLVLQRSAEQEAALRKLLDEQQIKSSPNYHRWLTPEQFGQQFGPVDGDIQAVTDWLASQGFQVSRVAAGRTVIEFSGTAGQVRQAFQMEIHKFVVNGEEHWANASDPQIPAALTPVVAGFASLNNFPKRPMSRRLGTFSKSKTTGVVRPLFTYTGNGGTYYAVGPADFATIYNVTPLWNAGIGGTGQTIAIVAQSNINIKDVEDFRSIFGLPANDPQIIVNGPDPGLLPGVPPGSGDEAEADLDVQWAGGIARGATVDLVVSETTNASAGVDLSAHYIIDNNLAPVMNDSYGECEAFDGASGNAFYYNLWEQGAAQGITILVAAGDSGSAGCDDPSTEAVARYGLAVSGNASTPFNVAVGGTDFSDSGSWQQYWNSSATRPVNPSAKSYIPEMTWNDSCASTGLAGSCTSSRIAGDQSADPGVDLVAGSGGPSNCAYGGTTRAGVPVCPAGPAGTAGIPKPAWQTGTGVPNDGVRDTPDVSLFAGDGYVSRSFYVFCETDANAANGGSATSCDLSQPYLDFQGAGGTSFSAQAFGGIMALVNQVAKEQTGVEGQGNANYVLYPLALQSGASCASSQPTYSCIFYDVQTGNNSVACQGGSLNCSNTGSASGNYGILVVPGTTSTPGWTTNAGYNLATGLGTVNAYNLVQNWTTSVPYYNLSASPDSFTIVEGGSQGTTSGTTTISVSPVNNFSSTVSLSCTVSSTMAGGSCSLNPPSVTPGNTATLTVYTNGTSAVIGRFNSPHWLVPMGGAIFTAFFLLVKPAKRRRLKLAFGSLFLVLLAAALVACGGGGSSSSTTSVVTPSGNYTVTVTGTSGSLSKSLNVTVAVQ